MTFLRGLASMTDGSQTAGLAAPVCFCLVFLAGCAQRPRGVDLPSVDPSEAAEFAIEHYDVDHSGAIDAAEMASCPPLVVARASYDVDSDGQLSADEIEGRLTRLYGPGAAMTGVDCAVAVGGRSLHGATVKFRPVEMLGESVKPAQGLTDESGLARIALEEEALPDDLKGAALMQPGLYHVEITHPKVALPARYNTATELGFEVDPSRRDGTSARFDLKSR